MIDPVARFIVDEHSSIEDLLERIPGAQRYLSEKGIRCVICGEPVWGSLGDAVREKGFDEKALQEFILALNALVRE